MNKICTSLEQSQKLKELGINVNTADMWYLPIKRNEKIYYDLTVHCSLTRGIIPAWSISALLYVINQVREINHQRVTILVGRFAGNHWYVEILRVQDERSVVFVHSEELVDACYEMILNLKELNVL